MRSTNFEKVGDFNSEVLGIEMPGKPRLPVDPAFMLMCLEEELHELTIALQEADLASAADALIDLIYFAYGDLYKMGLHADELFDIVHSANMRKTRGATKRGYQYDAFKPEDWADPVQEIRRRIECDRP